MKKIRKTMVALLALAVSSASAQNIPRTGNLGISGPTMKEIGGPGEHFLKYNTKADAGSAVREGLMPPIHPIVDAQIRDAVICIGHDGRYYMTGSCGDNIWKENAGVEVWVSSDLRSWGYMGIVWTFEKDATWQREWRYHHRKVRALWAPELHYVKGNYFITLSMPPGDRGLLKSVSGLPEGPYVNALADDGKWDGDIDASLFEDTDGTVYAVWGGGRIAKMKDDMSGFAEEPRYPQLLSPDTVASHHAASCPKRCNATDIGHEGAFVFKRDGKYYMTAADQYEGRYSSMVAVADNIYGPYSMRHEAVPCGGGTGYFRDHDGNWWCTFFGNDSQAPFREMPSMIRVSFSEDGHVYPAMSQPLLDAAAQARWTAIWTKVWKNKYKNQD
ncbi:MAG: family 43 glycosylhydrolase [Prevotella sp.]